MQPSSRTEIGDLFKKLHPKVDARMALSSYLKEQDGATRFAQRFRGASYAVYKAKLDPDGKLDTDVDTKRKLVVVTLKAAECAAAPAPAAAASSVDVAEWVRLHPPPQC